MWHALKINASRISVGSWTLGRLRHWQENNIKMDFRETVSDYLDRIDWCVFCEHDSEMFRNSMVTWASGVFTKLTSLLVGGGMYTTA
jgi:hypothetical protein